MAEAAAAPAIESVQCFGWKKTAVAVTYCMRGSGNRSGTYRMGKASLEGLQFRRRYFLLRRDDKTAAKRKRSIICISSSEEEEEEEEKEEDEYEVEEIDDYEEDEEESDVEEISEDEEKESSSVVDEDDEALCEHVLSLIRGLDENATDAMKESHIPDFLASLNALQYRRMDFEEFCAAALSVHQLEVLDRWEQHARCAYDANNLCA